MPGFLNFDMGAIMKAVVWTRGKITVVEMENHFFFLINSEKKDKTALDAVKVLFNPRREEFTINRKKSFESFAVALDNALLTVNKLFSDTVRKRVLNSFEESTEKVETVDFDLVDVFDGFF